MLALSEVEGLTQRCACPLCQSRESRPLILDDGVPVARCQSCGFAYAKVIPALTELRRYYTESHTDTDEWRCELSRARHWIFQRLLSRIRRIKPTGRWLDVGCSFGFLLAMARDVGYEVMGVEIAEPPARFARERLGLKVFNGTLIEAALPNRSFDIITFVDVLEHVAEPLEELKEVKRLLKPNGLLVLRVPNFAFHWRKTLLRRALGHRGFIGLDSKNHLNHFTSRTLTAALKSLGFSVLELRPGVPNLYGKPAFDALRVAYWGFACALAPLRVQVGNILECFAINTRYQIGVTQLLTEQPTPF